MFNGTVDDDAGAKHRLCDKTPIGMPAYATCTKLKKTFLRDEVEPSAIRSFVLEPPDLTHACVARLLKLSLDNVVIQGCALVTFALTSDLICHGLV